MPRTFSGAQLSKYGTQAGAVVEFEWVPDPLVFSEKVLEVRDDLENRTIPLAISRGVIARDIEANFEGEHDPQGQPWTPWSSATHIQEATGRRVRDVYTDPATGRSMQLRGYAENLPPGHSGKILNWRGILKAAATDENRFIIEAERGVNNDSLYFTTAGMPPYWEWHQDGLPDREQPLPQRQFLGMSGEAELQVLEVFEEWFNDILEKHATVETFTSSKGRTFGRRRIPKGQPGAGRFMPNN